MSTNGIRAAVYLRVSRDDQTTDNQRLVLERVAQHRAWVIVQTYEDAGISGAKGRDQRPAFDQLLKDAVRRKFDVLMGSGRSIALGAASSTWRMPWRNSMLPASACIAISKGSIPRHRWAAP